MDFSFSAKTLEWDRVRAIVGRFIATSAGRALLEQMEPTADGPAIESALAETSEAMEYSRSAGSADSSGRGTGLRLNLNIPDVTQAVQKLRIEGASLDPIEIYQLIAVLEASADTRSSLNAVAERFPLLGARAAGLGDFRDLLRSVEGRIDSTGYVLDNASPYLNRVRRDIERQRKSIHDSLQRFLKANRDEGVLQEEYVTIRNDRFVVPVLVGQRKKLPGVLHGARSSGQTVFLEPLETVELNNDLVRLQDDEAREVHRIVRELTDRLRTQAGPIREAAGIMAVLDFLFAKARFGNEYGCAIPKFGDRFHLENARHPLLMDVLRRSRKSVVPFTLTLDRECRTLLISGPNTGGKTVTLKTAGLVALMAQAALPVPCTAAELPLFGQILADIGDNQSIEQSLSTFSAHVGRLREMALDVTPDSLVLLDEIGSATDPDEGGALGVALVDHFRSAGAYTLASTHLTALKIYGAKTKAVLNASMGFDEETLAPTYQLRVGLPGKSAGLDIATRLGMPEDIMKRARAALSTREIELSELIADLHRRLEEAEKARKDMERARLELGARERRLLLDADIKEKARIRDLEERFDEMRRSWEEKSAETIARLEAKIAENADRRKALDHVQRDTSRFAREMREDWQSKVLSNKQPGADRVVPAIEEGCRVRVTGLRDLARVRKLLGSGQLEVEAGFMKMKIAVADVEEVYPESGGGQPAKLPKNVRYTAGPELSPSVQELNLIGERAEEAIDRLERFLDAAFMATAARVRIVHGHGMGILKRAVHESLKKNAHVEKFYPASQFEGGAGATIAELKD